MCLVGVALLVLLGCCLFCLPLFFVSAWWNRGIAEEVTMASYSKAVTGTAVMARSANEKKNPGTTPQFTSWVPSTFMLLVSLFGRSFFVVLLLFFQSRCFLTLPHLPHRMAWLIDPTPTPNSIANLGKLSIL